MDTQIAIAIVEHFSELLWVVLIFAIVWIFKDNIRKDLLGKLGSLKAMGVEFSFAEESIAQAIKSAEISLAEKSPKWKVSISPEDKERVLSRVKKHLDIFQRAQILWLDDTPDNNRNERKMFTELHTQIEIARTPEEARNFLKREQFDLIISDMARGDDPTAGLKFLKEYRKETSPAPVVFYIGVIDPSKGVPAGAFGITNRPDELLHLTLDALERKKYYS